VALLELFTFEKRQPATKKAKTAFQLYNVEAKARRLYLEHSTVLRQPGYTPFTLACMVKFAPRREGAQLKEQRQADSSHRVKHISPKAGSVHARVDLDAGV
jgi:hypothetical protein